MAAKSAAATDPGPTALNFNKELFCGECGALVVANGAAQVAARFTRSAAVISGTAVAGTLAGGSLFWLAVRIYDRSRGVRYAHRDLASDIGYFTPAAIALGLVVYDPAMYLVSHCLLRRAAGVAWSVTAGQAAAFGLFLGAMNVYRLGLRRFSGKRL